MNNGTTWHGVRFGLYTRLSQDRGAATSIDRQDAEARERIEGLGAVVVGTWSDPDASAYDDAVQRPGFDAVLEAARAGQIEAVAVWALDRLTRQPAQMEQVIALMRKCGLRLLSVQEGGIDLSMGALIPRFLTWKSEQESERLSQRVKSANRKLAKAGRPHPGGLRPFGHQRRYTSAGMAYLEAVPAEAALIREAAARLTAGESLYGIAQDWRGRDVQRMNGGHFTGSDLRSMLCKPRLGGYRERDGELHRADPADGGIEPILDDQTWRVVRATLDDPSRKRREVRTARHLLTGLIRCGDCGGRMVSGQNHGVQVYVCQPANFGGSDGACGKLSVSADPVEQVVAGAWIAAFDGPEAWASAANGHSADQAAAEVQLAELRERLKAATAAHFVEGVLSRADFMDVKRDLETRITDVERQLRRDTEGDRRSALVGRSEQVWDAVSLGERRALLALVIDQVRIDRRGRTGRFDPERVAITWRA